MRYVTYDNDGRLTGCYQQEVRPEHKPAYIKVTEDQALNWPAYRANAARNGVELAPVVVAPPTAPTSVPKLNARLVLIGAGYWEDVVQFVTEQGSVALAYLEDAQTMRRDNPLVNAWADARGKSGELDGLFAAAAALNVDENG